MSDTQAVEISNFIMTSAEEQAFFDGEDCATSSQNQSSEAHQDCDEAPAWEHQWEMGNQDTQQQETQVEDSFDWEAWLAEIQELPVPDYKPFDDLLKAPHYASS